MSLALIVWCAAFFAAAGEIRADGRKPGSVLVFPAHRSDTTGFTIVSVTNTQLTPLTPFSFGGSTNIHFDYFNVEIDPLRPQRPLSCSVFDRVEFLTPADTLSVVTACHNPVQGRGYLVVTAEDPAAFRSAWSHNHLVGSSLHFAMSGAVTAMPAVPFEAMTEASSPTDVNGDGQVDWDGVEYEELPQALILDSFLAVANNNLTLVDLTGRGEVIERNELYFAVWNDNEVSLSTTFSLSCWLDLSLIEISPLFSPQFMASVSNDPQEVDLLCNGVGDLETGWVKLASRSVRLDGVGGAAGTLAPRPLIGALTTGPASTLGMSRLLWEERAPLAPAPPEEGSNQEEDPEQVELPQQGGTEPPPP